LVFQKNTSIEFLKDFIELIKVDPEKKEEQALAFQL